MQRRLLRNRDLGVCCVLPVVETRLAFARTYSCCCLYCLALSEQGLLPGLLTTFSIGLFERREGGVPDKRAYRDAGLTSNAGLQSHKTVEAPLFWMKNWNRNIHLSITS